MDDKELDDLIREAYRKVNQDYLKKQAIIALVASGKNQKEAEEWLNNAEIVVNG